MLIVNREVTFFLGQPFLIPKTTGCPKNNIYYKDDIHESPYDFSWPEIPNAYLLKSAYYLVIYVFLLYSNLLA